MKSINLTNSPVVSICVPNLNTLPFLQERFDTIFNQTFQDFEIIVFDNYSDDGAWDYFQLLTKFDNRVKIYQAPREGLYANWNNCIRKARGKYIYIATSDDTMVPDCLEKMVAALESNPDCGLCQCGLEVINEKGKSHDWMIWEKFAFGRYAPEWVAKKHIRKAPLDGLLHFCLQTIYTSITQILIRRSVFDRVGLFETLWGSAGDFEWGMRAGLLENCVFLPGKLATWRVHPHQATSTTESLAARQKMLVMSEVAFLKAKTISPRLIAKIDLDEFLEFYREQIMYFGFIESKNSLAKLNFVSTEILKGNRVAITFIRNQLMKRNYSEDLQFEKLRKLLERYEAPLPVFL